MKTVAQKKTENLMFSCPHCSNTVPYIDVVSSHGIILLFGKDDGYYGATCPSCYKTILENVEIDDLEAFKQNLFEAVASLNEETRTGCNTIHSLTTLIIDRKGPWKSLSQMSGR